MDIGNFNSDEIIALQANQHSSSKKRKVTVNRKKLRKKDISFVQKVFPNSKKVLCMGCRDDSEVNDFVKAGYDAVGVDIANESELIKKVDAHDIINHFNDFDVVYASHILEHLTNPRKVMQDIRAITSHGIIIILPIAKMKKYTIPRWKHPTIFEVMKLEYKKPKDIEKLWNDFNDFAPYDIVNVEYRQGIGEREICIWLRWV